MDERFVFGVLDTGALQELQCVVGDGQASVIELSEVINTTAAL